MVAYGTDFHAAKIQQIIELSRLFKKKVRWDGPNRGAAKA